MIDVRDLDSISRSLQDVIDKGAKLEAKVKRVIQASDLAPNDHRMINQWSGT